MQIGLLGNGVFGSAIASVLEENGHELECVDSGESFTQKHSIMVLAVPVQSLREALHAQQQAYDADTIFINCSKGIEKNSGYLPHQIVSELTKGERYASIGGPSFASEIKAKVPTVVNMACTINQDSSMLTRLFVTQYFVVEEVQNVFELELAGAMKNIYALGAGYIAGTGGGENTKAHMQVIALREYTSLVHALEGNHDVVRPAVVGDLILTCASSESRNFQYGLAMAAGSKRPEITAEGVHTAAAIAVLAHGADVELPLVGALNSLVEGDEDASIRLYQALGFDNLTQ